jgi:hypothetical protein
MISHQRAFLLGHFVLHEKAAIDTDSLAVNVFDPAVEYEP